MQILITPFVDVTINAEWSDWAHYSAGRPNPLYSENAIDWGVDGLIFSFITLSQIGKVCWGAQDMMPLNWALPLAQELNEAGRKVIVSFGGPGYRDISEELNINQLITIYQEIIDKYHAVGLNFFIKNEEYKIERVCGALRVIQRRSPKVTLSFTLPVTTSGLTVMGIAIAKYAISANLNFVINGLMTDGSSQKDVNRMGKAAMEASVSIHNQLIFLQVSGGYQKVAITPMPGRNYDGSMFSLEDARSVSTFAKNNEMAFIGTWSFNRDNPSSLNYVDQTTSGNPTQRESGEYSRAFVSAAGGFFNG